MGKPTYKPGDTRKSKAGKLLRMSASGKWFKSSNSPTATQERAKNARLDAPIANLPGTPYQSSTTERQLAHQANAATTVQYGGEEGATKQALAQAVQHQQNVGSYYDDYRTQLQSLQGQAQAFNAGAMAAAQQYPGMVTGLAGQTQQQVGQNQAARGPEQGAIGAQTTATDASNAAAVGQSTAAALGANQALLGGVQQTYLGQLANNVAPAQKIQAVNQAQTPITNAQSDIKTLKQKEGAYNSQYRTNARQDETKNLLAGATLGLNTAKANATAQQNSPEGKAAAATATATVTNDARVAANHGYSLHDWRLLGPTKRSAVLAKDKKAKGSAAGDKVYTSGPFAGKTQADIQAMTPAQRDALINKKNGKSTPDSKGPNWRTPEQSGSALSDAVTLKGFAIKAKKGEAFVQGHARQAPLSRAAAAVKLKASTPKSIDPAIMSAVLDAAYVGHLSPYTVRKLIKAGFKPSQVSDALGVKTRGQLAPKSTTNYAGGGAAGGGVS